MDNYQQIKQVADRQLAEAKTALNHAMGHPPNISDTALDRAVDLIVSAAVLEMTALSGRKRFELVRVWDTLADESEPVMEQVTNRFDSREEAEDEMVRRINLPTNTAGYFIRDLQTQTPDHQEQPTC